MSYLQSKNPVESGRRQSLPTVSILDQIHVLPHPESLPKNVKVHKLQYGIR